jgi:hypothetical protein
MKYELTEAETLALLDTVKAVVDAIARTSLERARLREGSAPMADIKVAVTEAVRDFFDGAEDDDEDEDNDESGATVTPFPLKAAEPAPVPAAPVEPEEPSPAMERARAQLIHGRDLWLALIETWRLNWGIADAPQPERIRILTTMLHTDGASIFAYLRTKAGITDATRDVLCEITQWPLDNSVKREARLLAENIAQVCSFHAPEITEMLEYSAEFHILPE